MKIATWNINSINARLDILLGWCRVSDPDVLCLQETKCVDEKFPQPKLRSAGFQHLAFIGEKAYNGVAILSKFPILDLQNNFPNDRAGAEKRLIGASINGIQIVNVYVPHGTAPGTEKFAFKLEWLRRLRRYFDENFDLDDKVLLCGDLNVAPHEMDVWNPRLWQDKVHFSRPERDAIREVKKWGFVDVFRQINDEPDEYSWWDYFHHSFEKNRGLRIDHIWGSPQLAETCTDCWIDKEPRALEKASDHAPVIAEFMV